MPEFCHNLLSFHNKAFLFQLIISQLFHFFSFELQIFPLEYRDFFSKVHKFDLFEFLRFYLNHLIKDRQGLSYLIFQVFFLEKLSSPTIY